jgi:hypothetical protein
MCRNICTVKLESRDSCFMNSLIFKIKRMNCYLYAKLFSMNFFQTYFTQFTEKSDKNKCQ